MDFWEKFIPLSQLGPWREEIRRKGLTLVVTNGCFDLLHIGHATYLQEARKLGDLLLVGVNSDASVRAIKGPGRPIHPERDRAGLVAALASVDAVTIFSQPTALEFLRIVRPDIYVKGGDYTIDTINQEERRLVEALGGRVVVLGGVPGKSTTEILRRLRAIQ